MIFSKIHLNTHKMIGADAKIAVPGGNVCFRTFQCFDTFYIFLLLQLKNDVSEIAHNYMAK